MAALDSDYVDARKRLVALLSETPCFSKEGISEMSIDERNERAFVMSEQIIPIFLSSGVKLKYMDLIIDILGEPLPIMMHYSMFLYTIQTLCSEEQQSKWIPQCINGTILGAYAQTEMGWGSDLNSLETTATLCGKEWILNTPSDRAVKVWPGGLAGPKTTHAIVVAQVSGRITMFIVDLRSAGVTRGSVGFLMGFNGAANGWVRFTNVRVPVENALPAQPKHKLYGTMVNTRTRIIRSSFFSLAKAVTIAHAYAKVRQQPRGTKIIEHKHIQTTLTKWTCFAEKLGTYDGTSSEIALKAFVTDEVAKGIEECRRICGAFGYACHSMFPELLTTFLASVTYEGSNEMLYATSSARSGRTVEEVKEKCMQILSAGSAGSVETSESLDSRISVFGISQYEHNSSLVHNNESDLYQTLMSRMKQSTL